MRVMFRRRQRERKLDVFFPAKKAQDVRRAMVGVQYIELFFPVVIKLSRHNKKTAYFPPEPKTDITAQPARQTTRTFFPVLKGAGLPIARQDSLDASCHHFCVIPGSTLPSLVLTAVIGTDCRHWY
jgi:hypothetical protein